MEINKKNEDLDTLLFETIGIFEKYNFEWWFECGTLLGMIRESNYLNWEYDIDLGCWNSSLNLLITPSLLKILMTLHKNGFTRLHSHFGKERCLPRHTS